LEFSTIPEYLTKSWWQYWSKGILLQHKIIIAASLSSLFLFFLKIKSAHNSFKLKILLVLLFTIAIGWFLTAPSPRFVYGTLLILSFLPISFLFGKVVKPLIHKFIILIIITSTLLYIYKKSSPFIENKNNLIYPVVLYQPPFETITINGVNFHLPENINQSWMNSCYGTPLPCITEKNPFLEPRGNSLKYGFRMNQKPDSTFIKNYNY
jgi:hypothetical protein